MKNVPNVLEKDELIMQELISPIKARKPILMDSYVNWSIPGKPVNPFTREVKIIQDKRVSAIKLDFDSQYRLLKFLMRVV